MCHLENFPVVDRTLFHKECNFKKCFICNVCCKFADKMSTCHESSIEHLVSWGINIMLMPNHEPLSRL